MKKYPTFIEAFFALRTKTTQRASEANAATKARKLRKRMGKAN